MCRWIVRDEKARSSHIYNIVTDKSKRSNNSMREYPTSPLHTSKEDENDEELNMWNEATYAQ